MDYGIITERRRERGRGGEGSKGRKGDHAPQERARREGSAEGASGGVVVGVRWWWCLTAPSPISCDTGQKKDNREVRVEQPTRREGGLKGGRGRGRAREVSRGRGNYLISPKFDLTCLAGPG